MNVNIRLQLHKNQCAHVQGIVVYVRACPFIFGRNQLWLQRLPLILPLIFLSTSEQNLKIPSVIVNDLRL